MSEIDPRDCQHGKADTEQEVSDAKRSGPASAPELTDEQIDRILSTRIPGGSEARDWFLPHELPRGLDNVRDVVRLMLASTPTPPSTEDRWISVEHRLPPKETPVLILLDGNVTIGEIRWEHPGFEDTFKAYWYWDNPEDDGQEWERDRITYWMPLPKVPAMREAKP